MRHRLCLFRMFNFKIHVKKDKNAKKGKNAFPISKFIQKKAKIKEKITFFGFFAFILPVLFCIFNLKIHAKKAKKKRTHCIIWTTPYNIRQHQNICTYRAISF